MHSESFSPVTTISDLPPDSIHLILSSLSSHDLVGFSQVNSKCRKTVLKYSPLLREIHTESIKFFKQQKSLWHKYLLATRNIGNGLFYPIYLCLVIPCVFYHVISFWMTLLLDYLSNPFHMYIGYMVRLKKCRRQTARTFYGKQLSTELSPFQLKSILLNISWLILGLGLPISSILFIIGVAQLVTIIGISSGFDTLRLAWYLLWPHGYYYFSIKRHREYGLREKISALQDQFYNRNAFSWTTRKYIRLGNNYI